MKKTAILALLVFTPLAASAKPKPKAPCTVYFSVAEYDRTTMGLIVQKMNPAQQSWYRKHGDRGKLTGICYISADAPMPQGVPVYAIVWAAHSVDHPHTRTRTTTETEDQTATGTVTDSEGDTAQVDLRGTTEVPVQKTTSGVETIYSADGFLVLFNPDAPRSDGKGKGAFAPVGVVHNGHAAPFLTWNAENSAATSLLKDGLEQIRQREQQKNEAPK